jgi:hypothetical protein
MKVTLSTNQSLKIFSKFSKFSIEKIPSYIQLCNHEYEIEDSVEEIYELRETLLQNLTCGTALTYKESNWAVKFQQLATEVSIDCKLISSDFQLIMHKSYQEIIGMGEKIIPFLINQLDLNPNIWFVALESITGQNPVPFEFKGNVKQEVEFWKNWAYLNNYA